MPRSRSSASTGGWSSGCSRRSSPASSVPTTSDDWPRSPSRDTRCVGADLRADPRDPYRPTAGSSRSPRNSGDDDRRGLRDRRAGAAHPGVARGSGHHVRAGLEQRHLFEGALRLLGRTAYGPKETSASAAGRRQWSAQGRWGRSPSGSTWSRSGHRVPPVHGRLPRPGR